MFTCLCFSEVHQPPAENLAMRGTEEEAQVHQIYSYSCRFHWCLQKWKEPRKRGGINVTTHTNSFQMRQTFTSHTAHTHRRTHVHQLLLQHRSGVPRQTVRAADHRSCHWISTPHSRVSWSHHRTAGRSGHPPVPGSCDGRALLRHCHPSGHPP